MAENTTSKEWSMLRIPSELHKKLGEVKTETGIPIVKFVENAILEKLERDFPAK